MPREPRRSRTVAVWSWPPPAGRACGDLEVNEQYVAQIAERATELYRRKSKELADELGDLFLTSFFGGAVEVAERVWGEHASMLALARHEALAMPRTLVRDTVRYKMQKAELGERVGGALTLSHHRLLFKVRDPRLKARLAAQAVRADMRVRPFKELVDEMVGPDEGSRGRKPKPRLKKVVDGLGKALDGLEESRLTRADVEAVTPRELAKLRGRLRDYVARVVEMERELGVLAGAGGRR